MPEGPGHARRQGQLILLMKKSMKKSFDSEYDVIIIGYGGAGACAAAEAADRGARVLVIDRFAGGGATRMSGGVIYAGGGTPAQKAAGFADTPEKMRRYLARETEGVIPDHRLREFCEESAGNLRWLESFGISIPEKFFPEKTTQPPDGYGLYFSGNEVHYRSVTGPVPRGHVPAGTGMTGNVLFDALDRAARSRDIEIRFHTWPQNLIVGDNNRVTGVNVRSLAGNPVSRALHSFLYNLAMVSRTSRKLLSRFENQGKAVPVRGKGIVIAAGGFSFNSAMMREHAAPFFGTMPLGTPGDDGSGINLGVRAGGGLEAMGSCAASRFYAPPESFTSGMLVNSDGERICDESIYGATVSNHIAETPGGGAWLIIDQRIMDRARQEMKREEKVTLRRIGPLFAGELNFLLFRKYTSFMNMRFNRKKAITIGGLAEKCGIHRAGLEKTLSEYNRLAAGGSDPLGKDRAHLAVLNTPPFYAIDCRLSSKLFLSPCLTLGGLMVSDTSQVVNENGEPIPGLYAAGRSAVGICSRSYVSGLSLADCVFSGRRAGRHAAGA